MLRYKQLQQMLIPLLAGMGYELVELEWLLQGKRPLIRIYINKQGGVSLEDCQKVTSQVKFTLSAEAEQLDDYVLEVSSPGIDREAL